VDGLHRRQGYVVAETDLVDLLEVADEDVPILSV